jgi:hypothetical protein
MKRLNELQSLINLSRALDQEPDGALLEELEILTAQQEKIKQRIKENVARDLNGIFSNPLDVPVLENEETWAQRVIDETPAVKPIAEQIAESITRQLSVNEGTLVQPDPEMPAPTAALEQKIKYLEKWVSRIAATGPGGGAGSQVNLDSETTFITTNYTVKSKDYYIGVSSNTSIVVVLPTLTKPGRQLIIKDESGAASINTITVSGTVDNDTSGVVMAVNNEGLQLIYRSGWRII